MTSTQSASKNYLANIEANFQRGFLEHQKGLLSEAESWYRQVLQFQSKHAPALHLLGVVYAQQERYEDAARFIAKAAAISPHDFSIQNNLGNALIKLGQHKSALRALDKAIKSMPDSHQAWNNRGNALHGLEKHREALKSYDESLALRPDYAEALCNKANTLSKLTRYAEALEVAELALQIDPSMPLAHNTKGNILCILNQVDLALRCFDDSLVHRPEYALSYYGRGLCFVKLNRFNDAVKEFEGAISINLKLTEAYPEIAATLFILKRYAEALVMTEKAISFGVKKDNILGARTLLKTHICNWNKLDDEVAELIVRINNGESVAQPLVCLTIRDDLSLHRKTAEIMTAKQAPANASLPSISKRPRSDKIVVAYYSADFHDHATMRLMAEFFELHDRDSFSIYAFSFGPTTEDAMRKRALSTFDQFIDVNDKSDTEIAELSRQMGVDIAVDLKGYTGDCRPGIFAARAAPVQVNYLGYPGTMGAEYFDYILADPVVIPDHLRSFYTEKVVQLPHTYQVNDRKKPTPKVVLDRASCGLPEQGFIYCCFNNNFKMTAAIFQVWMRILQRVPASVLWLFADNTRAEENLRTAALAQGIGADRLVFARRVDYEQNLARQPLADLFLDTFPYNAHTTASDALWAGLPVLTLQGQSFAARVASSLLHAVGLPELVTTSQQAYEELAVKLALEPQFLISLRTRLHDARTSAPLFDTPLLTRDIENAYRAMYDRYHADRVPDHLVI